MATPLELIKQELEHFATMDESQQERGRRMLNITRDTGELLSVLVRSMKAKKVLEIGTSNGYSTLWLAEAAQAIGGHVTTVEFSEFKVGLARANFERAGFHDLITQISGDASEVLANGADGAWDFLFLDSDRGQYLDWWKDLKRALRPGGLLVVDNATSHPQEMEKFVEMVRGDGEFTTSLVPVGKGEFLAVKAG